MNKMKKVSLVVSLILIVAFYAWVAYQETPMSADEQYQEYQEKERLYWLW